MFNGISANPSRASAGAEEPWLRSAPICIPDQRDSALGPLDIQRWTLTKFGLGTRSAQERGRMILNALGTAVSAVD